MRTFFAKALNGGLDLTPQSKVNFIGYLRQLEGKKLRIEIEEEKPLRSFEQNRFYWLYLEDICKETGNDPNDLHELFKRKFLPPQFKKILGEEIKLPATTTELSKLQFSDYIEKIHALTGVAIPDSENYMKWVESAPLLTDKPYDNTRR